MGKNDAKSPERFFNRELSWLEFNDRVLQEGLSQDVPLLERLKFLAITSSNLDEFFMIRVAGLLQQRSAGVRKRDPAGLTPAREILPVLTPLAVEELDPCPLLPGLQLHVALVIAAKKSEEKGEKIAVVPVPARMPRFITVPAQEGLRLALLEDVIAANVDKLFPGCDVLATTVFRLTRDADVAIQDDDASDLLNVVEQAVLGRRRRAAGRPAV